LLIKLIKYELYDLLKSRWMLGITVFYGLLVYSLVKFGGNTRKAVVSYTNLSLLTLPLFSLLLSINYLYTNRNFIEFVLTQPVKRSFLFASLIISLSFSIFISYAVGSGFVFYYLEGFYPPFAKTLSLTTSLIPLFVSLGILSGLLVEDRLKGIGLVLLLWLFFSAMYDGIVLYIILAFSNYPIEKLVLFLTLSNPVDFIRLSSLMEAGLYEVMGFVGTWAKKYLKDLWFLPIPLSFLYTAVIFMLGLIAFKRKDF